MISLAVQAGAMSGFQVKLRFPHIVSPLASIVYMAIFGTSEQLRFVFENRLASTFDTHANTGVTTLHVSSPAYNRVYKTKLSSSLHKPRTTDNISIPSEPKNILDGEFHSIFQRTSSIC